MTKINKNPFSPTQSVVKRGTVAMLCVILSGLFLVAGCKKDPVTSGGGDPGGGEEPEYPIEIAFEEYSLETCQWTNLAYDDKVMLINSDEELERYIACTGDSYPAVDFSEYTLLLASGKTNGIVSDVAVKDLQQLSASEYELNIEITQSVFAIVEEWTVALIVEKVNEPKFRIREKSLTLRSSF